MSGTAPASVSVWASASASASSAKPSFAAITAAPAKAPVVKAKPPKPLSVPTKTYGESYRVPVAIPEHRKELSAGDYVVTTDLTRKNKPIVLRVKRVFVHPNGVFEEVEFENNLPGRTAYLSNYGKTYHPALTMLHVATNQRGVVFDMTHNNNITTYFVKMKGVVYYPTDASMKGFQKEF